MPQHLCHRWSLTRRSQNSRPCLARRMLIRLGLALSLGTTAVVRADSITVTAAADAEIAQASPTVAMR